MRNTRWSLEYVLATKQAPSLMAGIVWLINLSTIPSNWGVKMLGSFDATELKIGKMAEN